MDDPVNHPAHYTQYPHEVIELTEQLNFCMGNAVKYILRAPFKGHEAEDLKKAKWYVERARQSECFEVFDDEEAAFCELVLSFGSDLLNALIAAAAGATALTGPLHPESYGAFIAKLDLAIAKAEVKAEREALEAEKAELEAEILKLKQELFPGRIQHFSRGISRSAFPAPEFGDRLDDIKFTCFVR